MKKSILLFAVISVLCFLSMLSYAQAPNWSWAKSAGGSGNDYGYSIETDQGNGVFLNGAFTSGSLIFGTYTLMNAGDGKSDMFLVKYNTIGDVLWAENSVSMGSDWGAGICTDAIGNVYETGVFYGSTITFGSYTLTNADNTGATCDFYLAKYDANHNVLWAKREGGTNNDNVNCINKKKDSSDNVYVTGDFSSPTITFGSTTLTNAGGSDMYLAKYDANGNVVFAKSAGSSGMDFGNEVSVDASGNIYVEGDFNSPTITFGSSTLVNADSTGSTDDLFLVKYDANGNVMWAKRAGGSKTDDVWTVGNDVQGDVYIAGKFGSPTITFGTHTLTNIDNTGNSDDFFLVKYDANGNVVWAKSAGGNSYDWASHLNVDAGGNVTIAGSFMSATITFGSTTLTNTDNTGNTEDIFIVQYDANGNVNWAVSTGGNGKDDGIGCSTDEFGNVYVSGFFYSPAISFGSTVLTNADNTGTTRDVFIAKFGNNTGINEITNPPNISIFPNPAMDQLTIETSATPIQSQLSIINLTGQALISLQVTQHKTVIDIRTLPSGVYFLRVTNDKTVEVGKFIKQ